MKFMQYTKFMNDDNIDDTNLFDLEEIEASGTNIDVEEILVSQFPSMTQVWIFIFVNILLLLVYFVPKLVYIYIYMHIMTFILTFQPTEN